MTRPPCIGGEIEAEGSCEAQLTLDGGEVQHPPRLERRMTSRQRDLWLWAAMKPDGEITTAQAQRFFSDGSGALRRLEVFGAMQRVGRGRWRAV